MDHQDLYRGCQVHLIEIVPYGMLTSDFLCTEYKLIVMQAVEVKLLIHDCGVVKHEHTGLLQNRLRWHTVKHLKRYVRLILQEVGVIKEVGVVEVQQ